VGVYGLVAGIVKLDDLGLALARRADGLQALGRAILRATPWLMKGLSIAGTAAMFLVGGSILAHGVPALEHPVEAFFAGSGAVLGALGPALVNALIGLLAGCLAVGVVTLLQRLRAALGPAGA
jgi:predicted DNA repair protein MutK